MGRQPADLSFSRISSLHVMTLFTLAVAHPLYDVLGHGDHLPFFIAHQSRALDVWLLILSLSFALPAAICSALWLVNLLVPRVAWRLYMLLLAILFAALSLPIPGKLLADPGSLPVGLALVAAATATWIYVVFDWARTFLTFMSVTILLSPVIFLTSPSVKSLLSTMAAQDYEVISGATKPPDVLMIIFDELPLTSLLDEDREIDEVRYPNFHRLAKTATWYRNTTTMHYATADAITSLLIGGEVERYLRNVHQTAVAASGPIDRTRFPVNLFSLIENEYRVSAVELITKLARETRQTRKYGPPLSERTRELAVDVSILYGHIVIPARFRRILPPVEGQWRSFLDTHSDPPDGSSWPYVDSYGRLSGVKQLIDSLEKSDSPSFYFLHTLLPHYPFVFNARGQIHSNKFGSMTMHLRKATGSNDWPDETTANLAYQAHLLQLGFTDSLLGLILDKLAEEDLFEELLMIVTSDHGTSFYWDAVGLPGDTLAEVQARGTMYVPLIVKLPGQSRGEISDRPMQTIDVLPTLADILGLEIPWKVDGVSAHDGASRGREPYAYLPGYTRFGAVVDPDSLALRRKIELFGTRSLDGIYRLGPHGEMVDRTIGSFPSSVSTGTVELSRPDQYHGIDPTSPRVPAYVEGQIRNLPGKLKTPELTLAVAINGVIRSTTKTTTFAISSLGPEDSGPSMPSQGNRAGNAGADDGVHFLARVPPESFVKGSNEVTVHAVEEDEYGRVVSLIGFRER